MGWPCEGSVIRVSCERSWDGLVMGVIRVSGERSWDGFVMGCDSGQW